MGGVTRRVTVLGGAAALAPAAQASPPPRFAEHRLDADPGRLLAFIAAHEGRDVALDVRLPAEPRVAGVRHVFLRERQFLVVIDTRLWRPIGAMFWVGEDGVARNGHFHLDRHYNISSDRRYEGPSFRSIEDLPWLFRRFHVDPA